MYDEKLEPDQVDSNKASTVGRPMPPGHRVVVSTFMLLFSFYLTLLIIDVYLSEALIGIGTAETQALVTGKETRKGRSGTTFFVSYSFTVEEKEYGRAFLFGFGHKASKTNRAAYEAVSEGDSLSVVYSKSSPALNRPALDPYTYEHMFWYVAGALVFGFVSLHEFAHMRKKHGKA